MSDVRAGTATAERCGRPWPDEYRGPSRILPHKSLRQRPWGPVIAGERFGGSVLRAIRGRRCETDPVRGHEFESKAGRLLWPRWNRRIAGRACNGPDHAPGPKRCRRRETLGYIRETYRDVVQLGGDGEARKERRGRRALGEQPGTKAAVRGTRCRTTLRSCVAAS